MILAQGQVNGIEEKLPATDPSQFYVRVDTGLQCGKDYVESIQHL